MKSDKFLKENTLQHFFSHETIVEEGEYITTDNAYEYAKLYHDEQQKKEKLTFKEWLNKHNCYILDDNVFNQNDVKQNVIELIDRYLNL